MIAGRFLALMLVALASCRPTPSSSRAGVAVTTKVVEEHNDVAIQFEIKNGTSEPLVVVDRFLPWGGNAANWGDDPALDMRAVDSHGRELPKQYPVRELGPDATTTIAPGATAVGTLRPSHYFADFAEVLGRSDVRVEWKYRLNASGRGEMLFRGATELPRR
jgi:hypothetical protein